VFNEFFILIVQPRHRRVSIPDDDTFRDRLILWKLNRRFPGKNHPFLESSEEQRESAAVAVAESSEKPLDLHYAQLAAEPKVPTNVLVQHGITPGIGRYP